MEDCEDVGEWVNGEVVEELAGAEDEDEVSCISGSKYFIRVIRCQPGISCCGRSGCRMPLQWYCSASVPVPLNCS